MDKPLAIDLYCGLGGWAEGLLAEGWRVVGFDIERHDYGTGVYPGQLVLQDVTTLHGSQFKDAQLIVASPPCQAYSYRAMPWSRAKALPPPDNTLFEACFRIKKQSIYANGIDCPDCGGHGVQGYFRDCTRCNGQGWVPTKYIPLIVENVRGAQKWVGRAKWNFGSYYLWGDVPALMPITLRSGFKGIPHRTAGHWTNAAEYEGNRWIENSNNDGIKQGGEWWHDPKSLTRKTWSTSAARKAASAHIAKIPLPLAQHIAQVFK